MTDRTSSKSKTEENFKRISSDFTHIPDETLRGLYVGYCARLEQGAVIRDFIPLLAEKMVRSYLREKAAPLS